MYCCTKTFSGHGKDRALMSAQQLWLPEQDQDGKYSSTDRRGTQEALPLAENLLAVDGY